MKNCNTVLLSGIWLRGAAIQNQDEIVLSVSKPSRGLRSCLCELPKNPKLFVCAASENKIKKGFNPMGMNQIFYDRRVQRF